MKPITAAVLLLLVAEGIIAQETRNVYSDALYLKQYCDTNSTGKFRAIPANGDLFDYYFPGLGSAELDSAIKKNVFLKNYYQAGGTQGPAGFANPTSFLGKLGGLDVTNIANGIAQFMIKRAKEELTVAFFNRFKKFSEDNPEFRVLFPKTADNLENLLSYKYPDMLPALRSGFFDDLKKIIYQLDDVLELPRYQELLKNFPEIRVAIRSIRVIHEIEAGDSHPADVLKKFGAFPEWTDTISSRAFRNFGSSVKLAAIFSNSLRNDISESHDSSRAWISFKQLETLVTDTTFFRIYLGLVYQLAWKEDIKFYPRDNTVKAFTSIMEAQKDNLFLFQNKLTEFIELANHVDNLLDTLQDKKHRAVALTNDDYYDYIDLSLDVIEYAFSIGKLFSENLDIEKYAKIARKANDLYRNIYKEEYTQAVSNGMDILNTVHDMIDSSRNELVKLLNTKLAANNQLSAGSLSSADTTKALTALTSGLKSDTILVNKILALIKTKPSFDKLRPIIEKSTKYGLFMANIVSAKKPEEVAAALESATLPVGSSSIKKNTDFNIAVQSYLGAYWRTGTLKHEGDNVWSSRWGVIAPIGVAFSHGFKKYGSISLFGSLLDLGAIVDYQLKKDSVPTATGGDSAVVSKDYKVELGQIFSPGVYLVYGLFGNVPLSIGFGAQYGPGLGKITPDNNVVVNNPQWRWNLFVAVDIPFFNLVNRNKKYKP